jgi:hypothetical protein
VDNLARRLDDAVTAVLDTRRDRPGAEPSPGAFGADAGGTPGRLGRALHERWVAVLAARAQEAADAATALTDLAGAVRTTVERYEVTDDLARRRINRGS